MKKLLSIFCVLVFISGLSVEAFSKTYKIGCVKDYYPYITVGDDGELEGVIIDWWKLWSLKAEVEIEFVQLDISSCIEKTKSGEIDAIAGLFYSEDRAVDLDFSEPIMRMKTVLFLKNGISADSIQNIESEIGIVNLSLANSFLDENYPQLKRNSFDSFTSLMNEIYRQNLDGFTFELPNPFGNYIEPKSPDGYYKFATLFTHKLRTVVKKGNKELSNLIVIGASKITNDELLEIAEESELFKEDNSVIWLILVLVFIMCVVIFWLAIRNHRNKKGLSLNDSNQPEDYWKGLINQGENDHIEFKSSLRWDYRLQKESRWLENGVIKTIAAFLNTEGGMLFIGVDDEGKTLGLGNDYSCLRKSNRDGFLLLIIRIINQKLGKDIHKFLEINIISLNSKDICIVNVGKSSSPIFFGKVENERFYIRASASSQPLSIQETYKYIKSHWKS